MAEGRQAVSVRRESEIEEWPSVFAEREVERTATEDIAELSLSAG